MDSRQGHRPSTSERDDRRRQNLATRRSTLPRWVALIVDSRGERPIPIPSHDSALCAGRPRRSHSERFKWPVPCQAQYVSMSRVSTRRTPRRTTPGVPWLPALALNSSLRFPVGQSVPLGPREVDVALTTAEDTLRNLGFRVSDAATRGSGRPPPGKPPNGGPPVRVAERAIRRGPIYRPALHAILALMGAGLVLATVETYLAGPLVYSVPWVLGAGVLSLGLWFRYGRTFESDVIVAMIRGSRGAKELAGAEGAREVVWQAGRVRSVLHGGQRTAVKVIGCHPVQMRELVQAIGTFVTRVRSVPAPAVSPASSSGRRGVA